MTDIPWDWSGSAPNNEREGAFRETHHELLTLLASHGETEGAALESYARLIEKTDNKGIQYLGQLILEDEARHHRIMYEMLNTVRSFVEERDVEGRVPAFTGAVSDDLVAETKRLLDFEKKDLAELRTLRKDLKRSSAYRMLTVLVDMMIHDTRKHIDILKAILAAT